MYHSIEQIQKIGIAGSGTMGSGIAQVFAQNGFSVVVYDITDEMLKKSRSLIENSLSVLVEKNKLAQAQKNTILSNITFTTSLRDLIVDFIVEAIVEKLEIKQQLFSDLDKICSDKTIYTTNTSSLQVTELASILKQPQRLAGMHFFNPAQVMKLVEVIQGKETATEVYDTVFLMCKKLGKSPVRVKDSPGFIVNRVARPYYLESLKILEENVTDIKTIDAIMENNGFKLGPFRLMDLIGIDVNLSVTKSIYHAFNEAPRFRPSPLQELKVKEGNLGKKTGRGFY